MYFDYEPLEQLDYVDYLLFADSYVESEIFETNYIRRREDEKGTN